MKVFPYKDVEAKAADEGSSKLKVRWLITREIGAPNFAMRLFEMEPDGYSPLHTHGWEHEVFILEGEGVVKGDGGEKKFKAGDVVFVPSNEKHQFRNTGKKLVKFICVVPCHEE
ncbi:MAG: cupin domain-containing protein [Candidatus Bathyarchaeia archaeon]|jgi:quercetin dioxygenase-like cupin family protein